MKLSQKKDIGFLAVLCSAVYFCSYISRVNLSAVLVEVIGSGYATRETAALALTVCSVTYGVGQLISGYLGDKFKPQNIIFTGFLITSAVNVCVGAFNGGEMLVVLWAVNGFAQAFMWPPLVKILSSLLTAEDYKKACVKVSWGSSFGTILVYLLSPLIINARGVRSVFIISGVLALLMAFVWISVYNKYSAFNVVLNTSSHSDKNVVEKSSVKSFGKRNVVLLGIIMSAILVQGMLRDGVTNWTPTYISEIFNLNSSSSILTGVILPVFSVLSFSVVSFINRKLIKNEMLCAASVFGVGCISSLLLVLFGGENLFVSLLLLALLVGSMHGVNLILVCTTPAYFAKHGKVSFISGLVNSCTYAGAAVSTYAIALFTESFGWSKTIVLWTAVGLVGVVLCALVSQMWKNFKAEDSYAD